MSAGPEGTPIRRGWYYVAEPDGGRFAADARATTTRDGRVLTKRPHGFPARVEVTDASGADLPRATLLRAADAVGHALEALDDAPGRAVRVRLGPAGTATACAPGADGVEVLALDGPRVAATPSHHPVYAEVARALAPGAGRRSAFPSGALPPRPVARALFFESLMNTEMEHNDRELSQGVLHMVSPLADLDTEVVLADVKMSIFQKFRNDPGTTPALLGLERLEAALAGGPVGLVCITLLEAYFHNVVRLVARLRELGCRAHIAVGGVMPTLTPEHVAAHLPDVSFVCRGAGEYFVPRLCRILGDGDVDTPLTDAQRAALLAMDGLVAVDRAGRRLLLANDARAVQVDSLDRVRLDLSHLRRSHLQHGVEISTSRGCIYHCSFCTIIGQSSYQARSAESIVELLGRYHDRFRELFGDAIPPRVFRVHISDDDFACDRDRAAAFFRQLLATPFRLASCQVSIADLCRREGGRLLPEPDHAFLDAIRPECFFDHGRPIAPREYVEDHGPRRWSAHLQAGVESFHDAELTRHGKGYKVAHLRAAMAELAARGLHLDAYFILSNAATTAEELVGGLEEACRLKLRHPVHFHVKYPVTPRLVSIFPSASYRRHLRLGTTDAIAVDARAEVPAHPEYDYFFAEHDVPFDPWVREAVAVDLFTDRHRYTGTLAALADLWGPRVAGLPDGDERRRGERLLRRLDDATRALVFWLLGDAGVRPGRGARPGASRDRARDALETALELLGPAETWLPAYRRHATPGPATLRAVLDRGEGDAMDLATLGRCLDLLASSRRPDRALVVASAHPARALALVAEALAALPADAGPPPAVTLRAPAPAAADLAAAAARGVEVAVPVDPSAPHPAAPRGPAAGPWTAELRLAPGATAGLAGAAAAALRAGATALRLVPDREGWDPASEQALPGHLQALARAAGEVPVRGGAAPLPVPCVTPDGVITAPDGTVLGHLGDLRGLDRALLDAPLAGPTRAERLVESFVAWRAGLAAPAAPP